MHGSGFHAGGNVVVLQTVAANGPVGVGYDDRNALHVAHRVNIEKGIACH